MRWPVTESQDYREKRPTFYVLLIPSGNELILGTRCVIENMGRALAKTEEPAKLGQPCRAGQTKLGFRVVKAARTCGLKFLE